jgi:hypothetical protein
MRIELPVFGMVLDLEATHSGYSGTCTSDLHVIEGDCRHADGTAPLRGLPTRTNYCTCSECHGVRLHNASVRSIEDLVLAHACAGIDVARPAYLEGIETAVAKLGDPKS